MVMSLWPQGRLFHRMTLVFRRTHTSKTFYRACRLLHLVYSSHQKHISSQSNRINITAGTATGPVNVDPEYLKTCGGQEYIPGVNLCILDGGNVDVYYWPEPDANTACLAVVGNNTDSPFPEATRMLHDLNTFGYWGCTADSGSSIITTASEHISGTVTLKQPVVNPWSPQPCVGSAPFPANTSSQSAKIQSIFPSLQARDHSLVVPQNTTQSGGLLITTAVLDNYTLSVLIHPFVIAL